MKILSFGEIIWDIYDDQKCLGGAPLNFAAHCAVLGAKTWLISSVGNDDLGKEAIHNINQFNVNTQYITLSQKETGKCIVKLNENSVPIYDIVDNVSYDYIQLPHITDEFDVIAFGTLALRKENNKNILTQILKTHSFSEIFTDLNIRKPFYSKENILFCLQNATIVKISDEEMPIISETIYGEYSNPEDAVLQLCSSFRQIKLIIVTMGEKGSFCYDCKENSFEYCDAQPTNVVSTVGAGDSFGASFLVKYMENNSYSQCLEFASKVSAFVCSKAEAVPQNMPFNP